MPSVDNELVLWSGTSGTEVKRATGSGAVRITSGVLGLGDAALMPWISGNYYDSSSSLADSAWGATSANALRLYATPIYVPNDVTISEAAINVTTGVASALARIGLYSLGSDNKPGALFWQGASTLDVSSTGEKILSSLSVAIPGGRWYYTAMAIDLAGVSTHGNSSPNVAPLGYTSHSSTGKTTQYFKTLGSLVLPDPFGTPTGVLNGLARVSFKVA